MAGRHQKTLTKTPWLLRLWIIITTLIVIGSLAGTYEGDQLIATWSDGTTSTVTGATICATTAPTQTPTQGA